MVFLAGALTFTWGTAQEPDILVFQGKEYALHSNPLERYFNDHPEKRPEAPLRSTNLWRGYVARFELTDGKLYLTDILIQKLKDDTAQNFETVWVSVLADVFPGQKQVLLDWYTGILVCPYGKLVNYVHMGYGSTYEYYKLFEITTGGLTGEKDMGYEAYLEFRKRQFEAFQETEEYQELVRKLQEENDYSREYIDGFLSAFVTEYTSRFLAD
ncbi:MAG TPA: hypothetical protein ENN69_06790 [Spirochaetia bacterium]|nr:hypothetical protein [Spirochaetia bacterium]